MFTSRASLNMRRAALSEPGRRAVMFAITAGGTASYLVHRRPLSAQSADRTVISAIGNTPLVEIKSLSKATGCRIMAKMENLNPGGSIKDRAALYLIEDAERKGLLRPGDCIVEGTGGNTGIGLAVVANAKGYRTCFAMPETIAREKIEMMRTFGAEVILTPNVPFSDARHYFHVAAARGNDDGYFFPNQFENLANSQAHYQGTAPEIWKQADGRVDGFVAASGTGGTIGGCSQFLKEKKSSIECWVLDPHGSAVHDYVLTKACKPGASPSSGKTRYSGDLVTRYIDRSPGGSITEGIGIDRVTCNFDSSKLDGTMQVTDRESIEMAYHLLRQDGMFIGPSAALNVVGAVKLARKLKAEKRTKDAAADGDNRLTVVTVICDGGDRYQSKIWTQSWLEEKGLVPRRAAPPGKVHPDGIWFVD